MTFTNTCPDIAYNLSESRPFPGVTVTGTAAFGPPPVGAYRWSMSIQDILSDGDSCFVRIFFRNESGGNLSTFTMSAGRGGSDGPSSSLPVPAGTTSIAFYFGTTGGDNLQLVAIQAVVHWEGVCGGTYCEYGTEQNPSAAVYTIITNDVIDAVAIIALTATGQLELLPYVVTALAALLGLPLLAVDCSVIPPPIEPLDIWDIQHLRIENIEQWFRNGFWHFYCQCVPAPAGLPDPVFPPLPPITPPPSTLPPLPPGTTTPLPPLVCSTENICDALNHVYSALITINRNVTSILELLTRPALPIGYRAGTRHSGLTGSGQLAVRGILGLSVEVVDLPRGIGRSSDEPVLYHGIGWIATGVLEGWRRSQTISHNPMFIEASALDTVVGYTVQVGATINLVELLPL